MLSSCKYGNALAHFQGRPLVCDMHICCNESILFTVCVAIGVSMRDLFLGSSGQSFPKKGLWMRVKDSGICKKMDLKE